MRKWIAALAMLGMLVCALVPSVCFTEDNDTILLARTIYALGRDEGYDVKLKLGTVVFNRLENDWFADELGEVLRDQQQFPAGSRYDGESLRAAHALLSGERALPENALYYQVMDASSPWGGENLVASAGNYNFYSASGNG